MKNLLQLSLIILMALLFTQCSLDEDDITPNIEATIVGEWQVEGFDNVRYHFTEDQRYTVYGNDTIQWPTLEEFLTENPDIPSHEWHYEENEVVIDLHFGNTLRLTAEFKCNNKVIQWIGEDGELREKYYRVDHDIASCN